MPASRARKNPGRARPTPTILWRPLPSRRRSPPEALDGYASKAGGPDDGTNHAVALAVEIQLAVGVNRQTNVGAAAHDEPGRSLQVWTRAAARVICRFDDGVHRVVHFLARVRRVMPIESPPSGPWPYWMTG